jgi:hypothetical protein
VVVLGTAVEAARVGAEPGADHDDACRDGCPLAHRARGRARLIPPSPDPRDQRAKAEHHYNADPHAL